MLKDALSNRFTSKVIGNTAAPHNTNQVSEDQIDDLLDASANAPFHYVCTANHQKTFSSPVPWRAYKLNAAQCNNLMQEMLRMDDKTKIPNMLAAAEYLIQVTWLPDEGTLINQQANDKTGPIFQGTMRNMEHIAAASSFIQSILLAATDLGYRTYWSSGGPLREKPVFDLMSISKAELLLGSIFLFPASPINAEIKPGANRDKRGSASDWSKWCKINN